ncbi:MAG: 50S ribosomal protein L21 [Proteobacteria bacterium]|nr:50S ribosomal protein L21 [Pseudomonadota bacterium]
MYAVIRNGGKQYRVTPGQVLKLEKISAEAGDVVKFEEVLMVNDGDRYHTGAPLLADTVVTGEVVKHGRGPKIKIIKLKRRKHHLKHQGHRQHFTAIKVTGIDLKK